MDCPTIMVHAGKGYKALIDLGAAISLIWYSTYQHIDNSFKTPIQPTTAKLNTADGLSMTTLGMTALHLRISDFKFTHNLVICNRLPDTEIIFGINIQKKFSISYAWDKEKNCYIQRDGKFLTCMWNCEQKATIGIVKSSLKILPRHSGVVHSTASIRKSPLIKKMAIMKENCCTKYFPFTYIYVTLNKKPPITKKNLCIFFFCYRQSWVYQSKLQASKLRTIWLISLLMKIQQK